MSAPEVLQDVTPEHDRDEPTAPPPGPLGSIHRLRDLPRAAQVAALLLGLLLLVAPTASAIRQHGRWVPQGDDSFIALRAHDVGTTRSPLLGQPSTSGRYTDKSNVAHPGPIEFYLLAPLVRVLDDKTALLLGAAAFAGVSMLVSAWAVFRRWGPAAGLIAVLGLSLVMWTKGAATLVQPISSNAGGYPLLATTLLVWGVMCRDWRLLPLTVAFASFTAQQHLSVVQSAVVITLACVPAIGVALRRRRRGGRVDDELRRAVVPSAVIAFLCWLPVIVEQIKDRPGNVVRMVDYAASDSGEKLGYASALRQVAHSIGLPPLLGRTSVSGWDLIGPVSVLTAVSAIVIAGVLVLAAVRKRADDPAFTRLVVLGGVVAVAGLLTGASVPHAMSNSRIAFYHWAFVLAFVVFLAFWWLVVGWLRAQAPVRQVLARAPVMPVVAVLVGVAVLAMGVGEVTASSRTDRDLPNFISPAALDQLVDAAVAHKDELAGPIVVLHEGDDINLQTGDTMTMYARKAGLDVYFPSGSRGYANHHWTINQCDAKSALVVGNGVGRFRELPGRVIAEANPVEGFDQEAYDRLVEAAQGSEVVLGPDLQAYLDARPPQVGRALGAAIALRLGKEPGVMLSSRDMLQLLLDHPPTKPVLDPDDLRAVLASFPRRNALNITHLNLSIATPAEMRDAYPKLFKHC